MSSPRRDEGLRQAGRPEERCISGFSRFVSWGSFVLAHSWRHADTHAISVNELPCTCQQEDQRLLLHFISVLLMARMLSASSDALAFDSSRFMRNPFLQVDWRNLNSDSSILQTQTDKPQGGGISLASRQTSICELKLLANFILITPKSSGARSSFSSCSVCQLWMRLASQWVPPPISQSRIVPGAEKIGTCPASRCSAQNEADEITWCARRHFHLI